MFLPFLFIGVVGAVLAAASSRRKLSNQAWAAAAQELGIALAPTKGAFGFMGKQSMTGSIRGLTVTIDTHQSNDNTFTRYRVKYPALGLGLSARRQHALSWLGSKLGFQDIEIGDPVFDEAVVLKGDYPDRVASFLTPARRLAITGLIELYPGSQISDTGIAYSTRGLETDTRQLVSTMQRILSVAQELRAVDRYNREAADHRLAGDVSEALDLLENAPPSGDPFVDFARKEQTAVIRYARGDAAGARELFGELEQQAPVDPVVTGWAERLAVGADDETGTAPTGAGEATDDAATVAAHLFHKDNYSFDTMDLFESEYQGRQVAWSGELRRLRRFDHDRDFGDGPGVKAVFAIAILGTDLYSGREVDAVVRLPHGTEQQLEIGERYSFTGTLARCDPAMRNLFVTGAKLT
jgi:hypothetical protein